tara:strand:- start:57 stop:200 length:144 start_codon:yes stop_codon:yes gene_type:complete
MKVEFNQFRDFSDVLKVNDWSILDSFNIDYDELDGVKRIVITRETNG